MIFISEIIISLVTNALDELGCFFAKKLVLWRTIALRKKCLFSELFWSVFSRISPYSVRMRENADQNNSEYGQFPHSVARNVNAKISQFSHFFSNLSFHGHWRFTGKQGKRRHHIYSSLPFPRAHKFSNIYLKFCIWDDELVFL